MKKTNCLERAMRGVNLSDDARYRILSECKSEAESQRKVTVRRSPVHRVMALAATVALLTCGIVTAMAINGGWLTRFGMDSHLGTDPDIIAFQSDKAHTVSQDGKYALICDAVSGDKERLFFSLSVSKTDGNDLMQLEKNEILHSVCAYGASADFGGDLIKELYVYPVTGSDEKSVRLEGTVLLYTAEQDKVGENATLNIDGFTAAVAEINDIPLNGESLGDMLKATEPAKAKENGVYITYSDGVQVMKYTIDDAGIDTPLSDEYSDAVIESYTIAPHGELNSSLGRQPEALYLRIRAGSVPYDKPQDITFRSADAEYETFIADTTEDGFILAIEKADRTDFTEDDLFGIVGCYSRIFSTDELCSFEQGVTVGLDFKCEAVDINVNPVTVKLATGDIVIDRVSMTNSQVNLYGTCTAEGKLYDLDLNSAYAVCEDGSTVALGGKNSAGSLPDGSFTIQWQNETVIDPEKIVSIIVNGTAIDVVK